jgi:hypothetical protein
MSLYDCDEYLSIDKFVMIKHLVEYSESFQLPYMIRTIPYIYLALLYCNNKNVRFYEDFIIDDGFRISYSIEWLTDGIS